MVQCNGPITGRRKIFWTTQPDACGEVQRCASTCGSSGLKLIEVEGQVGRTIQNDNYVRSLAINILLTDGRKDATYCGHRPGARGGHWADTFRDDGGSAGTNIRDIPAQKSVADNTKMIVAFMKLALQKLVTYGVALSVDVKVKYIGGNNFQADADIVGTNGISSRVGITGQRLENSWVWGPST